MRQASVIIGSGYGDEGKGLVSDAVAARYGRDALVVRFNGGAQAGHTVVTADGRRHVFSHIASGSFNGAATFLSRFFVCQPMLFRREFDALRALGVSPRVWVDPASPLTTPFDVMLNQQLEASRGSGRHGSCGLGFGETIERHQYPRHKLVAGDLVNGSQVADRLRRIRDQYLPFRLAQLGLDALPPAWLDDAIIDRYLDDLHDFIELTRVGQLPRTGTELVFEGAQGLLLDMDRGAFPHVTRSNTGLKNAVALAAEAGIERLRVHYVSRLYSTRHGAGPLRGEWPAAPLPQMRDPTNQPNDWQGTLRHAPLDRAAISAAVRADLADAAGLRVEHDWVLTWANLAFGTDGPGAAGRNLFGDPEQVAAELCRATDAVGYRLGFGPSRVQLGPFTPTRSARWVTTAPCTAPTHRVAAAALP